ncbi:MAG: heliorhodopsin HeR [Thermomicrobiales bacterium]
MDQRVTDGGADRDADGYLRHHALIGIFGANAAMIYFGMVMEIFNRPDDEEINWTPYLFGCVAGAVPWIAIGVALIGAQIESDGQVPTFVFGIFVSLFILFNSFAVNMVLQYKRVGKWRDYIFGERAYIVLSLTAKTALARQDLRQHADRLMVDRRAGNRSGERHRASTAEREPVSLLSLRHPDEGGICDHQPAIRGQANTTARMMLPACALSRTARRRCQIPSIGMPM